MAIHCGSRVTGLVALLGLCLGVRAAETDRVVRDLCGKSIAMLGESPLHGFGNTLEFKVGLVRRLVDECHFNAFFMESGIYDFLNIREQRGQTTFPSESLVSPHYPNAMSTSIRSTRSATSRHATRQQSSGRFSSPIRIVNVVWPL